MIIVIIIIQVIVPVGGLKHALGVQSFEYVPLRHHRHVQGRVIRDILYLQIVDRAVHRMWDLKFGL